MGACMHPGAVASVKQRYVTSITQVAQDQWGWRQHACQVRSRTTATPCRAGADCHDPGERRPAESLRARRRQESRRELAGVAAVITRVPGRPSPARRSSVLPSRMPSSCFDVPGIASAAAPNPIQSPSSAYRARLRPVLTLLAGTRESLRSSDAASSAGLAASASDATMTVHAIPAFCSAISKATPRPRSAIGSP